MNKRTIYSFVALAMILFFTSIFFDSGDENEEFSERVKISLREVGHQLLQSNQDSTSLILPVVELEQSKYRLSFQSELSFDPDSLASIVKRSFEKSTLPKYYRIEVNQCSDHEVAYSYEVINTEENSIIPCKGRFLPDNCYAIVVRFTDRSTSFFSNKILLYFLIFIVFGLVQFIFYKRQQNEASEKSHEKYDKIGRFKFYQDQNKLVKEAQEISLSKKECELLAIFIANPNQIIKRDELMKKVWEDHGVFVSRSLDTYISKLRKILKDDDSIKLINVHGVGYKLEILN